MLPNEHGLREVEAAKFTHFTQNSGRPTVGVELVRSSGSSRVQGVTPKRWDWEGTGLGATPVNDIVLSVSAVKVYESCPAPCLILSST